MRPADAPACLTHDLVERLAAHARAEAPRECCGLLTLAAAPVAEPALPPASPLPLRYQPVRNVAGAFDRYVMDPDDLLTVLTGLESEGGCLWGIFHSHPAHPAVPSAVDLAEAHYPAAVYLILSLVPEAAIGDGLRLPGGGALRAFRLTGTGWVERGLQFAIV